MKHHKDDHKDTPQPTDTKTNAHVPPSGNAPDPRAPSGSVPQPGEKWTFHDRTYVIEASRPAYQVTAVLITPEGQRDERRRATFGLEDVDNGQWRRANTDRPGSAEPSVSPPAAPEAGAQEPRTSE